MTVRRAIAIVWRVAAVAALVAIIMIAVRERRRADALAEAARVAEAERLRAAGVVVAERRRAEELAARAGALADEIAALRAAAPDAELRDVVAWRSEPMVVSCESLLSRPPAGTETRTGATSPDLGDAAADVSDPVGASSPRAAGVTLEVRGVSARLETRAGNIAAVGEVEIWRIDPPPPAMIARVPWRSAEMSIVEPRGHDRDRWIAGPAVGLVGGRPALGAVVMSPAWTPRLGRRRLPAVRPWGVVAAGGGDSVALVGVSVSW